MRVILWQMEKCFKLLESAEVMAITIRPFQENNEEFVVGLNKKNQEVLIPMDNKEIRFLCDKAELFDIVYVYDTQVGFIVALKEKVLKNRK